MSLDPVARALNTSGHLWFPSSRALAEQFNRTGGHLQTLPTGHLVFYRPDGRRFLATDPAGHPLHECEWETTPQGGVTLTRARVRLDWGRWVGIKPSGFVNDTRMNLAVKPGWERIQPDDLRTMAAKALRVPIEEVRWFYRDEDLTVDGRGGATIRHRKDALYVLEPGGFERARFMSCMGAMQWSQIDFLPVVELFKSLYPGTGSAVFELIRGLYDDQNKAHAVPHPLRYRGVPPYPSEAAFRLFSSFFTPQAADGGDPLRWFMDPSKSSRVTWLPAEHPPVRYIDEEQGVCLTVQNSELQKATRAQDSAGLAYFNPVGRRVIPLDRSVRVVENHVMFNDRETQVTVPLPEGLRVNSSVSRVPVVSPIDWRTVFVQGVPSIGPADAFESALLYPDDEQDIGELAAQPFVADYIQDVGEQDREIGSLLSKAEHVSIVNGDAVIATCVLFDRPRDYTVSCHCAPAAQRQAQQLWTQCAEVRRWEWLTRIRIMEAGTWDTTMAGPERYDLLYRWVPYGAWSSSDAVTAVVTQTKHVLRRGGDSFLVGPAELEEVVARAGLAVRWSEPVASLPTFRMHKTILPKARLRQGLTLFHTYKA